VYHFLFGRASNWASSLLAVNNNNNNNNNCGFYTIWWDTSTKHVRPIMIVKIHSARNRHNFSIANIPCSNQKGWTTTTSNVVRKAPKITQLEHKKRITQGTSALIYRQGRSVQKKTWPFIPCRLPPPPLVVAGGTDRVLFLAFGGGWFKFKLGYLRT
jgi:hypothetical protein